MYLQKLFKHTFHCLVYLFDSSTLGSDLVTVEHSALKAIATCTTLGYNNLQRGRTVTSFRHYIPIYTYVCFQSLLPLYYLWSHAYYSSRWIELAW